MTRRKSDRKKRLKEMMARAARDRKKAIKAGRHSRANELEQLGMHYEKQLIDLRARKAPSPAQPASPIKI